MENDTVIFWIEVMLMLLPLFRGLMKLDVAAMQDAADANARLFEIGPSIEIRRAR